MLLIRSLVWLSEVSDGVILQYCSSVLPLDLQKASDQNLRNAFDLMDHDIVAYDMQSK